MPKISELTYTSSPSTADSLPVVDAGTTKKTTLNDLPVSSATQTALNLKAPIASPTFTGTVTIPAGASISGFAPLASPTFTGTVSGITKSMVGLSNVDNTSDVNKPVSTAQQTAINAVSPGRLLGVQRFTANGTYTPTAGTNSVIVEVQAGGGAGGGAPVTGAGQMACGCGGGAGGYAQSRLTTGFSGVTVSVGAGGTGAAGANGGYGGNSSFGALLSAVGGAGGAAGGAVSTTTVTVVQPSVSGSGSSGNIVNATGESGGPAFYLNTTLSGYGGSSRFGGGAGSVIGSTAGGAASSYGSGGSGGSNGASSAANAGGAGAPGVVIVWEYA